MRTPNLYEQHLLKVLKDKEYMLGKELNEILLKQFPLSPGSERKILQRAVEASIIRSTSPVSFGNGQYVYWHPDKKITYDQILRITKELRPGLHRIMKMLRINGGIISFYEARKVAGIPIDPSKTKQDSLEKLIGNLKDLYLAEVCENSDGVKFLVQYVDLEIKDQLMVSHYKRMKLDAMFIPDILKSLRKYNLIDNGFASYRNKINPEIGAIHNNYLWDAISYTKTTGINLNRASESTTPEKQTLVALDIVIHRPYTEYDLDGFVSRIQSVVNSVKSGTRKVLPVIIHSSTETKKLLNTIHKLGFLTFDVGTIYGSSINEIINNLFKIQMSSVVQTKEDIAETITETLEAMRQSGQEDNLSAIKGDLFEYLMYPILRILFPQSIPQQGRKLISKKDGMKQQEHEYDYILPIQPISEVSFIELKGYASSNYISLGDKKDPQKNTVRWFFTKAFPFAKQELKSEFPSYKFTASFITTSSFKEDALEFLEKMNRSKTKPNSIDSWYDGKKLLALLDQHGQHKAKDLIKRYYIDKATKKESIDVDTQNGVKRLSDDLRLSPVDDIDLPF